MLFAICLFSWMCLHNTVVFRRIHVAVFLTEGQSTTFYFEKKNVKKTQKHVCVLQGKTIHMNLPTTILAI